MRRRWLLGVLPGLLCAGSSSVEQREGEVRAAVRTCEDHANGDRLVAAREACDAALVLVGELRGRTADLPNGAAWAAWLGRAEGLVKQWLAYIDERSSQLFTTTVSVAAIKSYDRDERPRIVRRDEAGRLELDTTGIPPRASLWVLPFEDPDAPAGRRCADDARAALIREGWPDAAIRTPRPPAEEPTAGPGWCEVRIEARSTFERLAPWPAGEAELGAWARALPPAPRLRRVDVRLFARAPGGDVAAAEQGCLAPALAALAGAGLREPEIVVGASVVDEGPALTCAVGVRAGRPLPDALLVPLAVDAPSTDAPAVHDWAWAHAGGPAAPPVEIGAEPLGVDPRAFAGISIAATPGDDACAAAAARLADDAGLPASIRLAPEGLLALAPADGCWAVLRAVGEPSHVERWGARLFLEDGALAWRADRVDGLLDPDDRRVRSLESDAPDPAERAACERAARRALVGRGWSPGLLRPITPAPPGELAAPPVCRVDVTTGPGAPRRFDLTADGRVRPRDEAALAAIVAAGEAWDLRPWVGSGGADRARCAAWAWSAVVAGGMEPLRVRVVDAGEDETGGPGCALLLTPRGEDAPRGEPHLPGTAWEPPEWVTPGAEVGYVVQVHADGPPPPDGADRSLACVRDVREGLGRRGVPALATQVVELGREQIGERPLLPAPRCLIHIGASRGSGGVAWDEGEPPPAEVADLFSMDGLGVVQVYADGPAGPRDATGCAAALALAPSVGVERAAEVALPTPAPVAGRAVDRPGCLALGALRPRRDDAWRTRFVPLTGDRATPSELRRGTTPVEVTARWIGPASQAPACVSRARAAVDGRPARLTVETLDLGLDAGVCAALITEPPLWSWPSEAPIRLAGDSASSPVLSGDARVDDPSGAGPRTWARLDEDPLASVRLTDWRSPSSPAGTCSGQAREVLRAAGVADLQVTVEDAPSDRVPPDGRCRVTLSVGWP